MSRILITGATGYIGGCLVKELIKKHNEVFAIVRRESVLDELKKYVPEECLIFYTDSMMREIINCHPDILVHLAGKFVTTHLLDDVQGLLESNIMFPAMVCEAAYAGGCRTFINTGSFWQNYDNEEYNPVNYYAATKEAVKKIFQYYASNKDCYVVTLKIFDTYGPGDRRRKILNIISSLKDGESIDMTEGIQKIYPCYIGDVVNAYLTAIQRGKNSGKGIYEEFFLRGKEAVTLKDIVSIYLELSHKRIHINWGKRAYLPKDILDPTDYGVPLPGWEPEISLRDGLKRAFGLYE